MDASSPGERSHPVWIAPRFALDVLDRNSSGYQSICDERTMAAPRHCFGAHDRGSVLPRRWNGSDIKKLPHAVRAQHPDEFVDRPS
jgi:hypothetical protein